MYSEELSTLVKKELARAIEIGHPSVFASFHEGYGVMKEEFEEFENEFEVLKEHIEDLWEYVKSDDYAEGKDGVNEMAKICEIAFDEFIHFSAMIKKLYSLLDKTHLIGE